jgi:ParB family chromosome partitioning protein
MNVKDNEAMEISLIENLQRKDLGVFEEADGLKSLVENYGYSHNQISEKLGRARSTITEIISISKIPDKIRDICRKYGISSRSTILEIAKLKNANDMEMLIFEITNRSLTREDTRELSKKIKGKIKGIKRFVYNYSPKDNDAFRLRIEFNKQTVDREEIIRILEEVIKHLKSGPEK